VTQQHDLAPAVLLGHEHHRDLSREVVAAPRQHRPGRGGDGGTQEHVGTVDPLLDPGAAVRAHQDDGAGAAWFPAEADGHEPVPVGGHAGQHHVADVAGLGRLPPLAAVDRPPRQRLRQLGPLVTGTYRPLAHHRVAEGGHAAHLLVGGGELLGGGRGGAGLGGTVAGQDDGARRHDHCWFVLARRLVALEEADRGKGDARPHRDQEQPQEPPVTAATCTRPCAGAHQQSTDWSLTSGLSTGPGGDRMVR